jgi:hypothetical protein
MSFFMVMFFGSGRVSAACEGHAVGHGLELADLAPPGHQQEEAEVEQRADLRRQGADVDGGWMPR